MTTQEAIEILRDTPIDIRCTREDDIHTLYATAQGMAIEALSCSEEPNRSDTIYRQDAIDIVDRYNKSHMILKGKPMIGAASIVIELEDLPSAQAERKWIPCSNPPKHHKDVIVRGIEAIGNVTVHKVMQWDVDTWRPTDYAPSVTWKEWSEI